MDMDRLWVRRLWIKNGYGYGSLTLNRSWIHAGNGYRFWIYIGYGHGSTSPASAVAAEIANSFLVTGDGYIQVRGTGVPRS